MMHLIAHGFFKALLFLGAGSVIHGCHHEQDIRKMGGLQRLMPVTFFTYAIGMMTLSGVPFFFSGGWTKEEILHATAYWHPSHLPHYLMLAGVVLTALYMTRQIIYVFFGNRRTASELATGRVRPTDGQAHESPLVMIMPLIVLAACSIVFSVVLTPAWPWLHSYLMGEPAHFDIALLIRPMLFVSLALVVAGIGLGFIIYGKAGQLATGRVRPTGGQDRHRTAEMDPLEHAQPALFRFLANKMWLDELYDSTVINWSKLAAGVSDWMDRYFWDGLVRLLGGIGQLIGIFTTNFDERGINAGVDEATTGTRGLGRVMSAWHSGRIQTYLGAVAVGMLALLILYAWLA
jgi:NADH-quinone oxidoreductase subunit L